ncbi:UDP-N-acetylglucosamine 1-carboxyvinyltransferase [Taylorella equigenitalis]|uniref:UDP-N-acetylglucosamine 1-carboxyvinyltransferase n=1 Tax=Taylorella equigenitalis (strain MCE9) TaxID=937774 RepID=A0A654KG98_TAYEM|nr:UDP-N-acetylglucosamine 1-carboxyvinyltransferase [Taylorella equigenitalis]ADU91430.1 UDP-N-acetylglucosamine 1-carboxyvinyltransferase [Taylorella equigenitalis MCE9]WDU56239.1 UDP-N-acetylglucosamine 1-carboxyvinyltransferase [Taylorella equigenitalis]
MDKLKVTGGKKLEGTIKVSGAKNAALPILCASLLTSEPVILRNVPELNDIKTSIRVLQQLGVKVRWIEPEVLELQADEIKSFEAPYELVKTMRASILVLGPLLARFGHAKVSLPGGCAIGQRPVDQHIKGLKLLSADIDVEHGFVVAKADCLKGASIKTDMVTVGGTEQFLMASVLASGTTILENAAQEPEVYDLAQMLNSMGAKISGHGTSRITIEGVEKLHGTEYKIMPDRIEAGTFLCCVGATGGYLELTDVLPHTMVSIIEKLTEAGLEISTGEDWIKASMSCRPKAVSIITKEYPGFPTDMQAQLMALNSIADGESTIDERIFENRFMHVPELNRLGADITVHESKAHIKGVDKLQGAKVMATDLRASASLIIAALAAQGESVIDRIYHLDRGYFKIEEKLKKVGAEIERIS